jgi:hypothetical protein
MPARREGKATRPERRLSTRAVYNSVESEARSAAFFGQKIISVRFAKECGAAKGIKFQLVTGHSGFPPVAKARNTLVSICRNRACA